MRALGFDMSRDELDRMIKDIDPKNTGKIDFDDFLQIIILQISKKDPEEELIKAFKLFDTKNTGKICFSDLKRVAVELEEKMSDEEIRVIKFTFFGYKIPSENRFQQKIYNA